MITMENKYEEIIKLVAVRLRFGYALNFLVKEFELEKLFDVKMDA